MVPIIIVKGFHGCCLRFECFGSRKLTFSYLYGYTKHSTK